MKKIKKIDKELNLERVFPVGYKDIEIVSFEITENEITGKKSLGIYYSAAIEDSYGVFDSVYSYATIDLDIFLLSEKEMETQLIAFYRKIAGFHPYIETISIDNKNIYFTDAASGKEYFVPLELLSLPVEEAKEKYTEILKNEKQILVKEKKQRLESDIENYKKWLQESEEELEKLKAEEGEK